MKPERSWDHVYSWYDNFIFPTLIWGQRKAKDGQINNQIKLYLTAMSGCVVVIGSHS